jgi:hypothetical protein
VSDDARERLAADQARLVAALSGQAAAPDGFDAGRVELAARTLVAKRMKSVARACPVLAASLGTRFAEEFSAFAATFPAPATAPADDGLAFASWLDDRNVLPTDAIPELMLARLWRRRLPGLLLRRGPRGLLLGVRLPLLGVRLFGMR